MKTIIHLHIARKEYVKHLLIYWSPAIVFSSHAHQWYHMKSFFVVTGVLLFRFLDRIALHIFAGMTERSLHNQRDIHWILIKKLIVWVFVQILKYQWCIQIPPITNRFHPNPLVRTALILSAPGPVFTSGAPWLIYISYSPGRDHNAAIIT